MVKNKSSKAKNKFLRKIRLMIPMIFVGVALWGMTVFASNVQGITTSSVNSNSTNSISTNISYDDFVKKATGSDDGKGPAFSKMLATIVWGIFVNPSDALDDWLKFTNDEVNIVNEVWPILATFGMAICVAYFLIEINKTMILQGQDFTIKSLLSVFLKFGITYFFIAHGAALMSVFFDINNWLINQAASITRTNPSSITFMEGLAETISEMNLMERFSSLIPLMLLWAVSMYASLALIYQAVSRKLEMIIRAAFTPLALGDMYEGVQSGGFKYLKKFLALALWGMAMMLVLRIGAEISAEYISNLGTVSLDNFTTMGKMVLFPLAEAGIAVTLKQICNDVFGVL